MDLNYPLILMIATLITGVIALLDLIWLKKLRNSKVEALKVTGADEIALEDAGRESMLVENAKAFFPIFAFIFVVRSFLAEPFQIPSGSMEPGLVPGDFILVNKYAYGLRMPVFGNTIVPIDQPERGDVMVFFPPHEDRYFIKRVIGLPGDTIEYRDAQLSINGQPVPMDIIGGEPKYNPTRVKVKETFGETEADVQWLVGQNRFTGEVMRMNGPEGKWTVPEGHYFMMGDNRGNSGDSRMWNFVPDKNIVGKAVAVWMHWESWSDLPSFSRNKAID